MKIVSGIISVVVIGASYFNLKHFIFPDVEYGVIRCLKAYNVLAMAFELLCLAEMLTMSRDLQVLTFVIGILMGAIATSVITPITEEIIKALPILFYAKVYSDKRETIMLISLALGIGFGMFENTVILVQNIVTYLPVVILQLRAFARKNKTRTAEEK